MDDARGAGRDSRSRERRIARCRHPGHAVLAPAWPFAEPAPLHGTSAYEALRWATAS